MLLIAALGPLGAPLVPPFEGIGHRDGRGTSRRPWVNDTANAILIDRYPDQTTYNGLALFGIGQAPGRSTICLHSIWFPDHVCMPISSTSAHVANESRARGYEPRHEILDGAVVMGAIATATTRLKLGTSVLIAPYRHPLNDARQLATVDVLSGGRLLAGVGAGWLEEEFAALGLSFKEHGRMTDECIEIYKRSWTDEVVSFSWPSLPFRESLDGSETRAEAPTADRLRGRFESRRKAGGAPVRRPLSALSRSRVRSLPVSIAPGRGPSRARG
jgi:hypothetical protein